MISKRLSKLATCCTAQLLALASCDICHNLPLPNKANTTYKDNFETNKAREESYAHSPFLDDLPDINLEGALFYQNTESGRKLAFRHGFLVDSPATLTYKLFDNTPKILSGNIEFILEGNGALDVLSSSDKNSWTLLANEFAYTSSQHINIPLNCGNNFQYVQFNGYGSPTTIDDLAISVDYVK